MKQSTLLNYIALLTANGATVVLAIAVVTGESEFLGYDKWHLFACSVILYLASIAYGVGCLINQNLKK